VFDLIRYSLNAGANIKPFLILKRIFLKYFKVILFFALFLFLHIG